MLNALIVKVLHFLQLPFRVSGACSDEWKGGAPSMDVILLNYLEKPLPFCKSILLLGIKNDMCASEY